MKRILLLVMIAAALWANEMPAAVKVEGGLVQGAVESGLTVYRGIPFAAPPVGDLRWRAPEPAAKWEGVRQALKFGPSCVQGMRAPGAGQGPETGEDCLYLNVWTPAKSPRDRIPVLVWIYGGGFNAGATSEPNYSGEKLAQKGVVLVSIAYRVGRLGFLAHPDLSAERRNHVSGNYGLLDMIAGLQWVRKNIGAFGGDPHRVTIFGESAGGIAVSMLCASPLAKGLFQGVISQSGGSFGPSRPTTFPGENLKRLPDAERSGEAYAKAAGASSIAELRKLPADKLQAAGRGMGLAWPIIDGWVIPDDQYKLYEARRYNDTPILVGYNSDEGASFSPPKTPEEYVAAVKGRYGPLADKLIAAYPPGSGTVAKTARDLTRDAAFGWHTWIWARLEAQTGKSKVFYYCFDQHPEYPADSPRAGYGSPHGMDVAYVFQHLNSSNSQKSDPVISEAMATYWTNFAKRGDPNGEGVPAWPAFNDANPVVMYFAQTPHTGPVPSAAALKVLDEYFAWRRTPEGEGWATQPPAGQTRTGAPPAGQAMPPTPKAGVWPLPILPALPAITDQTFFARGDVPHGKIELANYKNYAGEDKRMHVYLPPDYAGNAGARYPVLYLNHGGGDDDSKWTSEDVRSGGYAGAILDNLIGTGKAKPMIIVMPNTRACATFDPSPIGSDDKCSQEYLKDIIPYVDSHYRTKASREYRALAGLSMGGMVVIHTGFQHLDTFSELYIYSSGHISEATLKKFDEYYGAMLKDPATNDKFRVPLYMAAGETDIALRNGQKDLALFDQYGLRNFWVLSTGGHEWANWRRYLYQTAQIMFPDCPAK